MPIKIIPDPLPAEAIEVLESGEEYSLEGAAADLESEVDRIVTRFFNRIILIAKEGLDAS